MGRLRGWVLAAVIIVLAGTGMVFWLRMPGAPPRPPEATFVHDGAVVHVDRNQPGWKLEITDSSGEPVLGVGLAGGASRSVRMFFHWTPGSGYRFVLSDDQGHESFVLSRAPAVKPLAEVSLEIPGSCRSDLNESRAPFGPIDWGMVPAGSQLDAQVLLVNYSSGTVDAVVTLFLPEELRLEHSVPGWYFDDGALHYHATLPVRGRTEVLPLRFTAGSEGGVYRVGYRVQFLLREDGALPQQIERTVSLVVGEAAQLSEQVTISEVRMPTDALGQVDLRRRSDTLSLPSTLGRNLERLLGLSRRVRDPYAPYAYQTLVLENHSDRPVSVVAHSRVTENGSDLASDVFRPLGYKASADGGVSLAVTLDPHRVEPVVLPIYLADKEVLPGRFDRVVGLTLMGTDVPILQRRLPLTVSAQDVRAVVTTLTVCVVSVVAAVWFAVWHRRVFARFAMREIVLISLFASLSFVGAVFPGSVLGPLIQALTGPFAFVMQGLFFEVIYLTLLIALVALAPKPGTVTLAGLVRYLVGGILLGGFTPVDLFYFASSVMLLETTLAVAGVTTSAVSTSVGKTVAVVLAVALANALSKYIVFQLNISFYRLFFASWFVALNVVVAGLLYGGAGAFLGWRLGKGLRRVAG